MILQKLKGATASFHQLAEEINFSNDLLNSSIKEENYLLVLKRMHGLEDDFISPTRPFSEINYHEYLGFCYVPMVSMLGGQYIYRKFSDSGQLSDKFPLTYYASRRESVVTD